MFFIKRKERQETPIEPYISCDKRYYYCPRCGYYDLTINDKRCPGCNLLFSWAFLKKKGDSNGYNNTVYKL